MIVVGTNLIVYLFLRSNHSSLAEAVCTKDPDWVAPWLWRSEFRNVLALYMRKEWLSLKECEEIMSTALDFMEAREYEVTSLEVLRLVEGSKCSAYDCEFVALAKELGTQLVTSDRQILKAFPATAVSMEEFAKSAAL